MRSFTSPPPVANSCSHDIADVASFFSKNVRISSFVLMPRYSAAAVSSSAFCVTSSSSIFVASRKDLSQFVAMSCFVPPVTASPSPLAMRSIMLMTSSTFAVPNSTFTHLDWMVEGILSMLVVASMNIACDGGSSSIFSSPLNALTDSMCTSSMMYILYFAIIGANDMFSISFLTSSMPVLSAPFISCTSGEVPFSISASMISSFLLSPVLQSSLASMRAIDVLPIPLCPTNSQA